MVRIYSGLITVRSIHKVIEHCLKTEERAERFLKVLCERRTVYDDLKTHGPQGKFGDIYSEMKAWNGSSPAHKLKHFCVFLSVRKDPPAMELTEEVCTALGHKVRDLRSMTMLPSYNQRIMYRRTDISLSTASRRICRVLGKRQ
jgi:hypothetical protein